MKASIKITVLLMVAALMGGVGCTYSKSPWLWGIYNGVTTSSENVPTPDQPDSVPPPAPDGGLNPGPDAGPGGEGTNPVIKIDVATLAGSWIATTYEITNDGTGEVTDALPQESYALIINEDGSATMKSRRGLKVRERTILLSIDDAGQLHIVDQTPDAEIPERLSDLEIQGDEMTWDHLSAGRDGQSIKIIWKRVADLSSFDH